MQESRDGMGRGRTSGAQLRYASLDHWRGVAALGVMVFHSFGAVRIAGQSVHPSIQWLKWLSDFGWFGVHLFFVISGYCIAANVCRMAQHRLAWLPMWCRPATAKRERGSSD
jgi:peptidoglycan/LPS O-acetylase OafA/YrhL